MKSHLKTAALALVLLASASGAYATDYPDGGVAGSDIASDLKAMGQTATVDKDNTGDPMIKASFKAGESDINYRIFFFGCKNGRCTSIQFFESFDGDQSKLVEWNSHHRFARAYGDGAKGIRIEYDVDLERGANTAAVQNAVVRFQATLIEAVRTLG